MTNDGGTETSSVVVSLSMKILHLPAFAAVFVALSAFPLVAQHSLPGLSVTPLRPAPGGIVRVALESAGDSVLTVTGEMAGEALHFRRSTQSLWRAIGPMPVDATTATVRAFTEYSSGRVDTSLVSITPPVRAPSTSRPRRLAVSSRFTRPLDSATQARIDRENELAREIGRRAHDTPPLWGASFLRPRPSAVTSRFGSGRTFNGTVSSRHLGVDFSGGVGATVRAANRGVVALADTFFLAGRVVYLDHGGGVVTGYFHLSRILVSPGDTVERGQEIGLVGATGRVTGPHLHWSARYGALTVNPVDLLSLGADYYGARRER